MFTSVLFYAARPEVDLESRHRMVVLGMLVITLGFVYALWETCSHEVVLALGKCLYSAF